MMARPPRAQLFDIIFNKNLRCRCCHYHQPYSSNLPLSTPITAPYFPRKYPHGIRTAPPPGCFQPFALTFSTGKQFVDLSEMNGFPFSVVGMCNSEKISDLLLLYKHISTCSEYHNVFLFFNLHMPTHFSHGFDGRRDFTPSQTLFLIKRSAKRSKRRHILGTPHRY